MKLLLSLSLLCSTAALAAQVSLSTGMKYEDAVTAIKSCGGADTTQHKQILSRDRRTPSGIYWWLEQYGIEVELEGREKIIALRIAKREDLGKSKVENDQAQIAVKSLTLDTGTKTFATVKIDAK